MLLDSNIFIMAGSGNHDHLLGYFQSGESAFSSVTRIEVLGYPKLTAEDEAELTQLLDIVTEIPVTAEVVGKAVVLRKRKKMSLGDAIIAATAILHGLSLITVNEVDFSWIEELEVINPIM
jgi:predicted nucleic acid-binding protein